MNAKSSTIAQRLLNLYRQEHVIFGGWAAVNQVFMTEATDDVLSALGELPTGKNLVRHIENLRSGKTPMDSIERDLLPYGGLMDETVATVTLTKSEWAELESGIDAFTTDQNGLDKIQQLNVVKKFGDQWLVAIRAALSARPDLLEKWSLVNKTYRAYYLWKVASDMLTQPLSERARAQLQADMPEYETYLPMFGDAGDELLGKLRSFISATVPDEGITNNNQSV
jgi:hypothetical protein